MLFEILSRTFWPTDSPSCDTSPSSPSMKKSKPSHSPIDVAASSLSTPSSSLSLSSLSSSFGSCPSASSLPPRVPALVDSQLLMQTICAVLTARCAANDRNPATFHAVTPFHGVRAPSISIQDYFARIEKYAFCSPAAFVLAVQYIDRLEQVSSSYWVTTLNVHRLFITAVMLAVKFIEDIYYDNAHFAKVGGLTTAEINRLELEMLEKLQFSLSSSDDNFEKTQRKLLRDFARCRAIGTDALKHKLVCAGFGPALDECDSSEMSGIRDGCDGRNTDCVLEI